MVDTGYLDRPFFAPHQIFGALGVVGDAPVERLYRDIRALRIHEGATEVWKLIIARELLKDAAESRPI